MSTSDGRARLANQERLRELRRDPAAAVTLFCAHDIVEFERSAGRSAALPAEAMARAPRAAGQAAAASDGPAVSGGFGAPAVGARRT
jgi:hypothetical protein